MRMEKMPSPFGVHYSVVRTVIQCGIWNHNTVVFAGYHCICRAIGFSASTITIPHGESGKKQERMLLRNLASLRTRTPSDMYQSNAMITGYALEGRLQEARHVFDKMSERNVVSWNAMIAGYANNGRMDDAQQLFDRMSEKNVISWTTMIAGYARNGMVDNARLVFEKMPERNMVSWNALIAGYVQNDKLEDGHKVFDQMPARNVVSWNTMITGYVQCGRLQDAWEMFDKMPERDVVSWTAVISGCAKNGHFEESLKLFSWMRKAGFCPNQFTFTSVLSSSAGAGALPQGRQFHASIIKMAFESDVSVGNALIDMYGKCQSIDNARQVLDRMPERDAISWTSIIVGYAQNECGEEALEHFAQMLKNGMRPNLSTFTCVLSTCSNLVALEYGKQVHTHIVKTSCVLDVNVVGVLVNMYCKCGVIDDAQLLFDKTPARNVALWNAMIVGCAQNQRMDDACCLFGKMSERNVISWNAMIVGHCHDGNTGEARRLFDKMPERNVASWTAIIAGYAQNGHAEEAMLLFSQMQWACIRPNQSTFTVLLSSCANLAILEQGKQVHAHTVKMRFESDVFVGSALIDMYAKCGSLDDAQQSFDAVSKPDTVSWTAIITAYAQHGHGKKALRLFEQMQLTGLTPNHITFVSALTACSHAGLVDEGWQCLFSMSRDHHIVPRAEHYACMVDLLGRSGRLDEAHDLINQMPFEPDAVVWKALLGACRIHLNIDIGKHAAERLFELEPQNSAAYVLLSSIYAAVGNWDDVAKIRTIMKDRKVKKKPGCSWIEIKNQVHTFIVGDRSHLQSGIIYAMLDKLAGQMKEAGYLPDMSFALHDGEE